MKKDKTGIVASLTKKRKWYRFYTPDIIKIHTTMDLMGYVKNDYDWFYFKYNENSLKKVKSEKIERIKKEYEQISLFSVSKETANNG